MLDVADFGADAHAGEFGDYGVCYVRPGKAMKGSRPKRRSVLTVWPWTVEVLSACVQEFRGLFADGGAALRPTERAQRLTLAPIDHRLAVYRRGRWAWGPAWTFTRCAART